MSEPQAELISSLKNALSVCRRQRYVLLADANRLAVSLQEAHDALDYYAFCDEYPKVVKERKDALAAHDQLALGYASQVGGSPHTPLMPDPDTGEGE